MRFESCGEYVNRTGELGHAEALVHRQVQARLEHPLDLCTEWGAATRDPLHAREVVVGYHRVLRQKERHGRRHEQLFELELLRDAQELVRLKARHHHRRLPRAHARVVGHRRHDVEERQQADRVRPGLVEVAEIDGDCEQRPCGQLDTLYPASACVDESASESKSHVCACNAATRRAGKVSVGGSKSPRVCYQRTRDQSAPHGTRRTLGRDVVPLENGRSTTAVGSISGSVGVGSAFSIKSLVV